MLTCKRCGLTDETVLDIDTGSTCHRELSDCIRRLRSIVDMLPKTADRVPVAPGVDVFHRDFLGGVTEQRAEWAVPFPGLLVCCYSTREAAEAARKVTS